MNVDTPHPYLMAYPGNDKYWRMDFNASGGRVEEQSYGTVSNPRYRTDWVMVNGNLSTMRMIDYSMIMLALRSNMKELGHEGPERAKLVRVKRTIQDMMRREYHDKQAVDWYWDKVMS